MFEITISTSKNRSKDISLIISKLRKPLKSVKGILVCEEIDGREKLSIAVKEDKKEMALGFIFDSISEAIVKGYKEEFLLNNLSGKYTNNLTLSAFVKALTMFDKTSDKDVVKKHLIPAREILLDSLYYFRLWELEKRWKEIVILVNNNFSYLVMSGAFEELMRFLISTNESEEDEVHVYYGDGEIFAKDMEGRDIFQIKYKEKDENSKIRVLGELISLSPNKIFLHQDIEDKELFSIIMSLFDSKVCVLE